MDRPLRWILVVGIISNLLVVKVFKPRFAWFKLSLIWSATEFKLSLILVLEDIELSSCPCLVWTKFKLELKLGLVVKLISLPSVHWYWHFVITTIRCLILEFTAWHQSLTNLNAKRWLCSFLINCHYQRYELNTHRIREELFWLSKKT